MTHPLCFDFKTPRADASKRLPPVYVAVPVLFYLVVIGGLYVCVTSYLNYRDGVHRRDQWRHFQSEQELAAARVETDKAGVEREKWKAEKLAQWIEGTRAIQPITVAISRSVAPEITVGELTLERSVELPQQVQLSVRIHNGSLEDVSRIQNALGKLSYRPYNSQQLKAGEALDYRSMLVWQGQ